VVFAARFTEVTPLERVKPFSLLELSVQVTRIVLEFVTVAEMLEGAAGALGVVVQA
jgi:hypothetical protein